MSQARKITKLQTGGGVTKNKPQYTFKYNNELVTMNEDELNNYYADFLNNNKGTKNQSDWNKDFTDLKSKILTEQQKGNYFSFDVGVDDQGTRTIGVQAEMPFANNAEKGLNKKGDAAKPGLFSNITGVKNDAARSSLLYGHMGQWLANTKANQDKQAAIDLEKAKQKEELEKAKLEAENNKFYGDFLNDSFNIPRGIFGHQTGVSEDSLNQMYLERYWSDPAKQPDYHRAYINKLRSQIGDTRYDNDTFRKMFKESRNMDWDVFKNTLTNAQIQDPNFDFQSFYDSIGLGAQYYNMNDKRIWDQYLKQKEQQPSITGNPGYDTERGLYFGPDGNLITEGIHEGLYIKDGKLGSGMYQDKLWNLGKLFDGEQEGLRYKGGVPLTGFEVDDFNMYSTDQSNYMYPDVDDIPFFTQGKRSSLSQFLLNPANENNPLYSQGHQLLGSMYDRYNFGDGNVHEERNWNRNPYPDDDTKKGVQSSVELTGSFTLTAPDKDGIAKKALLFEKLDGLDRFGNPLVQFRYIDEKGQSHTGKLRQKPSGQVEFISDKGQKFELGKKLSTPKELSGKIMYEYKRNKHKGISQNSQSFQEAVAKASVGGFKKGGILIPKAQDGRALYNLQANNKGVNTGEEYNLGTVLGDSGYKMTTADYAQLAALTADLGSLTAAFVPGANVAAATAGTIGSFTNYAAEASKTGQYGSSNLAHLGGNLLLDAASLLPIVGGGAKAAKIAKVVKKMAPVLTMTFGAFGLRDAATAATNIANGDYSAQNFRLLASGLTAALYGKRQATDRLLGTTRGGSAVSLKGKDGSVKQLNLTESQRIKLDGLEGEAKTKYVKELADAANIKDIDLEFTKGTFKTANPTKWFSKDNVDLSTNTRLRTKTENDDSIIGWFRERASKRLALNNPRMEGADRFMGGWTAVKNPLALSGGNKAIPVEKKGVEWNPWSMTYFRKSEQMKGMTKADAINLANKQGKVPFPKQNGLAPGTNQPYSPPQVSPLPQAGTTRPQFNSANVVNPVPKNNNINILPSSGQTIITPPMVSALPPRSPLPPRSAVPPRSILGPRNVFGASTGFGVHPNRTDLEISNTGTNVGKTKFQISSRDKNTYVGKDGSKTVFGKGSVTQLRKQLFGAKDTSKTQQVKIVDKDGYPTKEGMQVYQNIQKITNPLLKKQAQKAFNDVVKQVETKKGDGVFKLKSGGKVKKFQYSGILKAVNQLNTFLPTHTVEGKKLNFTVGENFTKPVDYTKRPFDYKIKEESLLANMDKNPNPDSNLGVGNGFRKDLQIPNVNINPIDISEFGRMLYNRGVSRNMKNPHGSVALLSNPTEIYAPVKGDLLTKMATINKGNNLRLGASLPMTSDGGVQSAMQLNANAKATDFELQGAIANSQAQEYQTAEHINALRQYAADRNSIANNNNQSMVARDQAFQMFENQRQVAMGQSVDNFWNNQNMRGYLNQQRKSGIFDQLNAINARQQSFGENAPVSEWKNKTIDQVNQSLVNEMNTIQRQLQTTPNDMNLQNRYNALVEQSRLLSLESEKLKLTSMLNAPRAGSIPLFKNKNKQSSNVASVMKRGGRVEYKERKSLLNHAFNLRNEAQWIRDYNQFIKAKLSADAKKAVASERSINEIVKIALNKK